MIKSAGKAEIAEAVRLLRSGALVALPTETVYGLAADALNSEAVAQIFAVKNRPSFNPLIIHVCDAAMAADYVEISPLAQKFMAHFWPGPLSLVLPLQKESGISSYVTTGLSSVAVRCPRGIFADIIRAVGRPLAAPSANLSGKISPTNAAAVALSLGDKIPLIIDGGVCPVGVESTIIKIENEKIFLLRAGGVIRAEIEAVAGQKIQPVTETVVVEAPGQMKSHYAPNAKLRLNSKTVRPGEALLAFGLKRAGGYKSAVALRNLSETGDMAEAAAHLFSYLAELDRIVGAKGVIAVEPVPHHGLGEAINDRLCRAAAEKDEILKLKGDKKVQ